MRVLRYLAALAAVLALVALTARLLSRPFEEAVFLAPIIVVGGAALVGLALLWGKVALNSLREYGSRVGLISAPSQTPTHPGDQESMPGEP